jgi:hypothetical protein
MLDQTDKRLKDNRWGISADASGHYAYEGAQLAVLMDIRDELKELNGLLRCQNFLDIPHLLRTIKRNTMKRKRPLRK